MRTRITAAVALVATLALAAAGGIVYLVEAERLENGIAAGTAQELDEFEKFALEGNPATGRDYTTMRPLFRGFLRSNVPEDCELLLGYWDGDARNGIPGSDVPAYDESSLEGDEAFEEAVTRVASSGGTTEVDTSEGHLRLSAQPVRVAGDDGALVVVAFADQERADLLDTMRTYLLVSLLLLLLVAAVAWRQSGRLLAPLRTLRETADRIGETDLSRRIPERGNDDITALTRTLNGMLARLETAFTGQRQFLDDAGHELKTPLTVLRGHLELLDSDDPAEVAETRELLLDEIDRMSRLVGDLILLAKTNRPDFLSPERVDVEDLTRTVLAKARALGERRWTLDGVAHRHVVLDEQRLTQALLALADNAVKHTTADGEVGLGSADEGDRLRFWVRDDGLGVPTADRERIFERFGRSRVARDDEGFGLGLSIVAAIARAHGGTAYVEDVGAPAGGGPSGSTGSRFVIEVPLGPALADDPGELGRPDETVPDETVSDQSVPDEPAAVTGPPALVPAGRDHDQVETQPLSRVER